MPIKCFTQKNLSLVGVFEQESTLELLKFNNLPSLHKVKTNIPSPMGELLGFKSIVG